MPPLRIFHTARRDLPLGSHTYFAGILNLTPDSFSDGGEYVSLEGAKERFHAMTAEVAEIIDIGGESTRPGFEPVSEAEELQRVVPFIEAVRGETEALISVDTSKSAVAAAALAAGRAAAWAQRPHRRRPRSRACTCHVAKGGEE